MGLSNEQIQASALHAQRVQRIVWYRDEFRKRTMALVQLLRELRDDKLKPWIDECGTFEEFCEKEFGMTPRRVQQILSADSARKALCDEAPELTGTVATMGERPMRELAATPKAQRIQVLRQALKTAAKPTAKGIKAARAIVIDVKPAPPAAPAPSHETSTEPEPRCPACGQALP